MNKTNVVILGTILCLTISGCSAKIEGGDPQASGVKPTPTPTPTSGQGSPHKAMTEVLQGNWGMACLKLSEQASILGTLKFKDSTFTSSMLLYGNKECKGAAIEDRRTGTFVVKGASVAVPNALTIDYVYEGGTKTAYDIFEVVGNNLYTGDVQGETPETRPSHLSQTAWVKGAVVTAIVNMQESDGSHEVPVADAAVFPSTNADELELTQEKR